MKLTPRQQHNLNAIANHIKGSSTTTEHRLERKVMYENDPIKAIYQTTDGNQHQVNIVGHIEIPDGRIKIFYLEGIGPRTASFVTIGNRYEI